jgi:hypothetical protein
MFPTRVGPQFEPVARCAARRRRLALAAWRAQRSRSTTSTSPGRPAGARRPVVRRRRRRNHRDRPAQRSRQDDYCRDPPRAAQSRRPATSTCPGSTPATNASDCVRHMVYSCRPHRFRIDCASAKRWACWPSSPATKSTGAGRVLASEPRAAQAVRHAVRQTAALFLALAMVNHPRLLFPCRAHPGARSRRTAGNVAADRASPRQGHHGRSVE